jgi:hypothetical protein
MRLKVPIAAALLLLSAFAFASAAGAWNSNHFVSPSRNIACRFLPSGPFVVCATRNDGFTVAIGNDGTKGFVYSRSGRLPRSLAGFYGPVLRYGRKWRSGVGIWCISRTSGMTCRTYGHGFFISRTTYDVW